MDPRYQQIAELFGLQVEHAHEDAQPRKRDKMTGRTAEESDEMGKESLAEGDYEEAIKHFKRAIEQRDPHDIKSHMNLGGALEYSEQGPMAMRLYLRALKQRKDEPEPYVGLASVLKRYSRFRAAAEELQNAIELDPGNAYLHSQLAQLLREMGEKKRALVAAMGAVAAAPDQAYYHYWIGDLLMSMNRWSEALESLQAAIELSPGDDHLFLKSAICFWADGKRTQAIKAIRLASDLDPSKHLYHGLLAVFLKAEGREEDAKLEEANVAQMDRYDEESLKAILRQLELS